MDMMVCLLGWGGGEGEGREKKRYWGERESAAKTNRTEIWKKKKKT